MTTTKDVLVAARDRIINVGWVKGSAWDYSKSWRSDSNRPACAWQSIRIAAAERGALVRPALTHMERIVDDEVPVWNDAPGRTKRQVIATFNKAIKALS